jgi:type VI secretion system Hcp family effector
LLEACQPGYLVIRDVPIDQLQHHGIEDHLNRRVGTHTFRKIYVQYIVNVFNTDKGGENLRKILSYAALLLIGIAIGGIVIYTTMQFVFSNDAQNVAYSQYEEYEGPKNYHAFLKITNIEGSSNWLSTHLDEIELVDFSWLETQSSTPGATGSTGQVTMEDFQFVFVMDPKASPELFLACAKGTTLEGAILSVATVPTLGKPSQDFLRVRFDSILISSFQTLGNTRTSLQLSRPLDMITIKYNKIQVEYTQLSDTGEILGMTGAYWDLPTRTGDRIP